MNEHKLFRLIRLTEQRNRVYTATHGFLVMASMFTIALTLTPLAFPMMILFLICFGLALRQFFIIQHQIETEFGKLDKHEWKGDME